jgi:hypothetical protein
MSDEKDVREVLDKKKKERWYHNTKLVVKFVVALGGLGAGVNEYVDLAERNRFMYEALSSKVNNMAEELAMIRGQNQMLLMMLGIASDEEAHLRLHMESAHARRPASFSPPTLDSEEAGEESGEEAAAEIVEDPVVVTEAFEGETAVSVELGPSVEQKIDVQAYEKLPSSLDDLVDQYKQ